MDYLWILISFVGVGVAILGGYFTARRANLIKKEADEVRKRYSDVFNKILIRSNAVSQLEETTKTEAWEKYRQFVREYFDKAPDRPLLMRYFFVPSQEQPTEEQIEAKIAEKLTEIKERVEQIESRFPKEATIDKIASVNDALLATQIESLTEAVTRIEQKILTKWDVAKIVFEILAGFGVLMGLLLAVIQLLK